jgi:hypothetical protein
MREQLERVWKQGQKPLSEAQQAVIDRIVRGLPDRIHPVSAIEYRKLLVHDDDGRSFLKEGGQTGIPRLSGCLMSLADRVRKERRERLDRLTDNFRERVVSSLRLFEPAVDSRTANSSLPKIRDELLAFLRKQRDEFLDRRGAFRSFWNQEITQLVASEVEKARRQAARRIRSYLNTLAELRWNVLEAAVTRGGTFTGSKNIDLPVDLSLCFGGAIAEIWGNPQLREMRRRNQLFGEACKQQLEESIAWVKAYEVETLIGSYQRQLDALDADVKELAQVGEDRTADIRRFVRAHLIDATRIVRSRFRCHERIPATPTPRRKRRALPSRCLFSDLPRQMSRRLNQITPTAAVTSETPQDTPMNCSNLSRS